MYYQEVISEVQEIYHHLQANGGKVNRCSLMSGKKIIIFHGNHSQ